MAVVTMATGRVSEGRAVPKAAVKGAANNAASNKKSVAFIRLPVWWVRAHPAASLHSSGYHEPAARWRYSGVAFPARFVTSVGANGTVSRRHTVFYPERGWSPGKRQWAKGKRVRQLTGDIVQDLRVLRFPSTVDSRQQDDRFHEHNQSRPRYRRAAPPPRRVLRIGQSQDSGPVETAGGSGARGAQDG